MSVSIKAPDENPSNIESILSDTIGLPGYTINPPGSRIEELLIELNELIKSGGDSDAYATNLSLTIDSSTYVITAVLKNKDGESIGTPQTIDLPMESVVVSGSYNSQTKKVVLTLQNGSTIEFSVADLISGLQEEITSSNKLDADLVDDTTSTHKFTTAEDISKLSGIESQANKTIVDSSITDGGTNPVTGGSIYTALAGKQNIIDSSHKVSADLVDDANTTNKFVTSADKSAWDGKQNALVVGTNLDDEPIEDSTNPITSGGVFDTVGNLDAALDSLIMSLEPKTITANGTYDPTDDGVDGYSEVTVNVPSGGGGGSMYDDVVFYDYDGSVVASYSAADFANLSAMPANPTHTGLTAQGWNWSLADAKSYVASYGKLNIGQMYTTSDGKTRLYFTVTKNNLSVDLYLDLESDTELDVDWGDNSAHTTWTSADGDNSKSHEYTSAGRYIIAITVVTGEFNLSTAVSNIYKVEIGNGVTSIDSSAFYDCSSLFSITIPDGVISIGEEAFCDCYALPSITIPNSVTDIGSNTFYDCLALSSIALPNSVTAIGDMAFNHCYSLFSIALPNSLTYISTFNECYALSSIIIPNSVTSIDYYAFNDCRALSSITIPNSVTSIGESAFNSCYALSSITFKSSTPPELSGDISLPNTCIIRVPQGSLLAYTSAADYPDPSDYIYEEY